MPSGKPADRPTEKPSSRLPEAPPPELRGIMAILLDDAGYDLAELQSFLELPIPLAIAVLPNLPHSSEAAGMVLASGKELLVHMPMEPEGEENPGPGALSTTDSPAETRALLAQALQSVPGARGVNNHMGSKATADEELMRRVLGILSEKGMYFVDSRTTARTVAERIAVELGVPAASRDLFIDSVDPGSDAAAAFAAGIERAARHGTALLIGHVQNREVLAILRASAPALREAGVQISPLSRLLQARRGGTGR